MTATGDERSAVGGQVDGEPTIVDVTGRRLIDLVDSRDPALEASIRELAALLDRSAHIRLGWQSIISEE